jgi:quinol monooxygenase YgiN
MKEKPQHYCVSYLMPKEGCREKLITALQALIEPSLAEAGCLIYEMCVDIHDANHIIMVEKFTSSDALAYHEEQPYVKDFSENVMYTLCDKVSWHEADIIDTKVLG